MMAESFSFFSRESKAALHRAFAITVGRRILRNTFLMDESEITDDLAYKVATSPTPEPDVCERCRSEL